MTPVNVSPRQPDTHSLRKVDLNMTAQMNIPKELENLDKLLDRNRELMLALGARLNPVLVNKDIAGDCAVVPKKEMSEVALALQAFTSRIEMANGLLVGYIDNLDV
jgi:hypothetical protein